MEAWKDAREANAPPVPQMEFIRGNGLRIRSDKGESQIGLDRIYIGAAVEKENLSQLASLLKPGGIFVGPGKTRRERVIEQLISSFLPALNVLLFSLPHNLLHSWR